MEAKIQPSNFWDADPFVSAFLSVLHRIPVVDDLMLSHFAGPLRTLQAARRFFEDKHECEVFETPDAENSEWCVLAQTDSEILRRQAELNATRPPADGEVWEYLLSKPDWDTGIWEHSFNLVEVPVPEDLPGASPDREHREIRDSTAIPASEHWRPEQSGVLFVLQDVCIGPDAGRLPKPELLVGLSRHIAGKSLRSVSAGEWEAVPLRQRDPVHEFATVQQSGSGVVYFVYTVCQGGPTHIFTEAER